VSRWRSIIAAAVQRFLASFLLEVLFDTVTSAVGEPGVHEVLPNAVSTRLPTANSRRGPTVGHPAQRRLQAHRSTGIVLVPAAKKIASFMSRISPYSPLQPLRLRGRRWTISTSRMMTFP